MIPRVMRPFFQKYGIALLAGGLLALAFPAWDVWPLAWVALALLVWRVAPLKPGAAAAQFFAAGYFFHLMVLHWLNTNLMWAGGWAVLGYLLISAILSIFWAVLGGLWAWVRQRYARLGGALTLAVFWVVLELVLARAFTGFGWTALAYSQGKNLAFLQWAAIGGTGLVGFFIVLFSGLGGLAIRERGMRWLRLGTAVVLLVGVHVGGTLLLDEASYDTPLETGLVQPSFPQELKFRGLAADDLKAKALGFTRSYFRNAQLDLVVWPEATLLYDPTSDPRTRSEITSMAKEMNSFLFSGSVRRADGRSFNSSILVSSGGDLVGHYDKVHLVPFGEYMPFAEYLPFLRQIVPSDADPGNVQNVLPLRNGEDLERTLGPLICFEVLYAHMAEELRNLGADVLVVVTNLAWFGRSSALAQELELARLRAIETRLPLIHSANTGISGVFDPYGRFTGMRDDYPPRVTANVAIVGTFEVPAAAPRPLPWAPSNTPWVFCVVATALVVAAGALGRAKPEAA